MKHSTRPSQQNLEPRRRGRPRKIVKPGKWQELVLWARQRSDRDPPPELDLVHLPDLVATHKIDELQLWPRTVNCLTRADLMTSPRKLARHTAGELRQIQGMGRRSLYDLVLYFEKVRTRSDFTISPEPNRTIEEELANVLQLVRQPKKRQIVQRLWGWDGRGPTTLQATGDQYGYTREYVRLVAVDALKLLNKLTRQGPPELPLLDRALAIMSGEFLPDARDIEKSLRAKKLIRKSFNLDGLLHAANVLGRPTDMRVEQLGTSRVIMSADEAGLAHKIESVIRGVSRQEGIVPVELVVTESARAAGKSVPEDQVRRVLELQDKLVWLDRHRKFFWLGSMTDSYMVQRILRTVGVVRSIEIDELRDVIARWEFDDTSPAPALVLELCRHLPRCRVKEKTILAVGQWMDDVLTPQECVMARMFLKQGPVITIARLIELCEAEGISQFMLRRHLSQLPFLVRCGPGQYCLRGAAGKPAP